jgi:hypothetical protein
LKITIDTEAGTLLLGDGKAAKSLPLYSKPSRRYPSSG